MILKHKLKEEPGFLYVAEAIETMSAVGQHRLMEQTWLTDAQSINQEFDRTEQALRLIPTQAFTTVRHQLMQLRDLSGTFRSLQNHILINEVELFEVKRFAQIFGITVQALESENAMNLLDGDTAVLDAKLKEVFSLLDPDHTGMAHFYIYDSYDPRLAPIRKALKASNGEDAELFAQQQEIEKEILVQLGDRLATYADALSEALHQMGYLDFLLAKAVLVEQWHLCRPIVGTNEYNISQLFNPRLKSRLESQKLRYQPVDIVLKHGVCLITGANMAGKTVLLKTVGVAQLMMQFGMFVPASHAEMALVDDVLFCIGDEQNEMNGLSSFASEIIKISDAVSRAEKEKMLILIDEPARTTNPIEGKAIVQSLASLLENQPSFTMVTTHYSHLGLPCRKLRVKGFVRDMSDQPLTPQNINLFMDYSLLPDNSEEVPQEALSIASILNCNHQLISTAHAFLQSTTDK